MAFSEMQLLQSAIQGDVNAFETLVETHEKRIYNLCLRTMSQPEDEMCIRDRLYVSPLMTLIILATLPILAVTTMVVVKRSQRYFTRMWRTVGDLNGNIEEIYTGHKVVKAFSCEEAALEDFDAINDQLTEVTVKAMFVSGITQPIMLSLIHI